jgi:hypothetical protein
MRIQACFTLTAVSARANHFSATLRTTVVASSYTRTASWRPARKLDTSAEVLCLLVEDAVGRMKRIPFVAAGGGDLDPLDRPDAVDRPPSPAALRRQVLDPGAVLSTKTTPLSSSCLRAIRRVGEARRWRSRGCDTSLRRSAVSQL